jgi:hypothetical protein
MKERKELLASLNNIIPTKLRPLVAIALNKLREYGYKGIRSVFAPILALIPLAHITGLESLFELIINTYYAASDSVELGYTLVPRWWKEYTVLREEVEALTVFEESLANSKTLYCAEPLLAVAIHGFTSTKPRLSAWVMKGFSGRAGEYIIVTECNVGRVKVAIPGSLSVFVVAGLASLGLKPSLTRVLVVVDPALIRSKVYSSSRLRENPVTILEFIANVALEAESLGAREACRSSDGEFLVIEYSVKGVAHLKTRYVC